MGGRTVAKHGKRLTKKEIREDRVAEFFLEGGQYLRQHAKKVTGVALVVAIAALIASVAIRQQRAAELEAQTWIARANVELKQGNVASAIQSYSNIMDRYRGTWSHSDAVFFSANAHFATGRYDSAMVLFSRYLNLKKRRQEFTVSSQMGNAQCLEELRRYAEAADGYLKVQRENPDSPFAPDALFGAGRCFELAGDLRSAEGMYSELVDHYPDSNQANMAKLPLLELQARLANT
jgi:TolA-binding protein